MPDASRHIVCPHCQGINRIPSGRTADKAKCGKCHKPLFLGKPTAVAGDACTRHVERNDIPVVVDFWADWCGPCKMMAPHFDQVTAEIEPEARFLKLDTEVDPGHVASLQIRGIPTTIVFKGGREIARKAGAMDGRTLSEWLRPLVSG